MNGISHEMEASKLSPEDQATIDRAWLAESRDRLTAFRKGEVKALDGVDAIKSIEQELK